MNTVRRQTKETFLKLLRIEKSGCWNFTGRLKYNGYAIVSYQDKDWLAHRLSWFFHNGEIPKGLCVCHKCDNRKCCNPDHLFLGTHQDNSNDRINKTHGFDHCTNGHLWTDESIYIDKHGTKICRICQLIAAKLWRQKQKTK